MADLYLTKLKKLQKIEEYDINSLLNKSLTLYYDDKLADIIPYIKKCLCIVIFFKYIDKIFYVNSKTNSWFCIRKNITNTEKLISDYFYKNKIPKFIDEILYLYRNKDNINIDKIKINNRHNDLSILNKYINNDIYSDKIINMTIEDKINLIKKIISEIIII